MPPTNNQLINSFAIRSFRDIADGDYIAARMASRASMVVQYLWASQQAIEKYLKCILLLNRIPATDMRHDLDKCLQRIADSNRLTLDLTQPTRDFIAYLDQIGRFRYLEVSNTAMGRDLVLLDRAVWELRRYCTLYPGLNRAVLTPGKASPKVVLPGGYLEKVIDDKRHLARESLLWQNAFFGKRPRRHSRPESWSQSTNSPLYLHPHILDEILQYVFFPRDLVKAYRGHARSRSMPTKSQELNVPKEHHCTNCNEMREFSIPPKQPTSPPKCQACGEPLKSEMLTPNDPAPEATEPGNDISPTTELVDGSETEIRVQQRLNQALQLTKNTINVEIRRRIRLIANDCLTFRRARFELPVWWKQNVADDESVGLGGGNHTIGLATLTACNFLAKAHAILRDTTLVATKDDVKNVRETIAYLKASPEIEALRPGLKRLVKDSRTRWVPPVEGLCTNELDAFVKMVEALHKDNIDLGLPDKSAEFAWKRFRNRIAHMAHPDGISVVHTANDPLSPEQSEVFIRSTGPAFRRNNGNWECRVDRLALDISEIAEWLCEKIDATDDYQRLDALGTWIFHQEVYDEDDPEVPAAPQP